MASPAARDQAWSSPLIERPSKIELGPTRLRITAAALLLACLVVNEEAVARPQSFPPSAIVSASAEVLSKNQIQGILGKQVLSSGGQDMGQIVNVIVDRSGQPRAVVVDFGGFLGVGSRKIAVDWNALHFASGGKSDSITLDLTPAQLKAAPEYQEDKPVIIIGPSGGTSPLPASP